MRRLLSQLVEDRSASAAVEMALVAPLLIFLMFGSVDVGNYFLSEHVVDKAVRDASRYAARLPFIDFDCASNAMTDPSTVQKLARTGDPAGTTARLPGWTADNMTTVTVNCDTDTTHSYVNGGIYTDFPNGGEAPTVTVSATVPYNSLFGVIGLGSLTFNLNAQSQAAVIGA
jgi:Flp pilus assembly protein TadG